MGGRLRPQAFEGAEGVVAKLAESVSGFRGPILPLRGQAGPAEPSQVPQPADQSRQAAAVVDLEGDTPRARSASFPSFTEVADAWARALEEVRFTDIQNTIRAHDVAA